MPKTKKLKPVKAETKISAVLDNSPILFNESVGAYDAMFEDNVNFYDIHFRTKVFAQIASQYPDSIKDNFAARLKTLPPTIKKTFQLIKKANSELSNSHKQAKENCELLLFFIFEKRDRYVTELSDNTLLKEICRYLKDGFSDLYKEFIKGMVDFRVVFKGYFGVNLLGVAVLQENIETVKFLLFDCSFPFRNPHVTEIGARSFMELIWNCGSAAFFSKLWPILEEGHIKLGLPHPFKRSIGKLETKQSLASSSATSGKHEEDDDTSLEFHYHPFLEILSHNNIELFTHIITNYSGDWLEQLNPFTSERHFPIYTLFVTNIHHHGARIPLQALTSATLPLQNIIDNIVNIICLPPQFNPDERMQTKALKLINILLAYPLNLKTIAMKGLKPNEDKNEDECSKYIRLLKLQTPKQLATQMLDNRKVLPENPDEFDAIEFDLLQLVENHIILQGVLKKAHAEHLKPLIKPLQQMASILPKIIKELLDLSVNPIHLYLFVSGLGKSPIEYHPKLFKNLQSEITVSNGEIAVTYKTESKKTTKSNPKKKSNKTEEIAVTPEQQFESTIASIRVFFEESQSLSQSDITEVEKYLKSCQELLPKISDVQLRNKNKEALKKIRKKYRNISKQNKADGNSDIIGQKTENPDEVEVSDNEEKLSAPIETPKKPKENLLDENTFEVPVQVRQTVHKEYFIPISGYKEPLAKPIPVTKPLVRAETFPPKVQSVPAATLPTQSQPKTLPPKEHKSSFFQQGISYAARVKNQNVAKQNTQSEEPTPVIVSSIALPETSNIVLESAATHTKSATAQPEMAVASNFEPSSKLTLTTTTSSDQQLKTEEKIEMKQEVFETKSSPILSPSSLQPPFMSESEQEKAFVAQINERFIAIQKDFTDQLKLTINTVKLVTDKFIGSHKNRGHKTNGLKPLATNFFYLIQRLSSSLEINTTHTVSVYNIETNSKMYVLSNLIFNWNMLVEQTISKLIEINIEQVPEKITKNQQIGLWINELNQSYFSLRPFTHEEWEIQKLMKGLIINFSKTYANVPNFKFESHYEQGTAVLSYLEPLSSPRSDHDFFSEVKFDKPSDFQKIFYLILNQLNKTPNVQVEQQIFSNNNGEIYGNFKFTVAFYNHNVSVDWVLSPISFLQSLNSRLFTTAMLGRDIFSDAIFQPFKGAKVLECVAINNGIATELGSDPETLQAIFQKPKTISLLLRFLSKRHDIGLRAKDSLKISQNIVNLLIKLHSSKGMTPELNVFKDLLSKPSLNLAGFHYLMNSYFDFSFIGLSRENNKKYLNKIQDFLDSFGVGNSRLLCGYITPVQYVALLLSRVYVNQMGATADGMREIPSYALKLATNLLPERDAELANFIASELAKLYLCIEGEIIDKTAWNLYNCIELQPKQIQYHAPHAKFGFAKTMPKVKPETKSNSGYFQPGKS